MEKHCTVEDIISSSRNSSRAVMVPTSIAANRRESLKVKQRQRMIQNPRRLSATTIKIVSQGDSTSKTIMNLGIRFDDTQVITERLIMITHSMYVRNMTITPTGMHAITISKDAPRIKTKLMAIRSMANKHITLNVLQPKNPRA